MSGSPLSLQNIETSIRGIREPKQRIHKIIEVFKKESPENIANFLHELCSSKKRKNSLLIDLLRYRALFESLSYEVIKSVYQYATQQEWEDVRDLLRTEKLFKNECEEKPEGLVHRLGKLTLGQRRQLSRDLRRNKLEPLLFDDDPLVIHELLLNPKLIERDVIRIAARHHAPSSILEEIIKSDRWITRYNIRKALAFNPKTPHSYLFGLLSGLRSSDIKLLLGTGTLDRRSREWVTRRFKAQEEP